MKKKRYIFLKKMWKNCLFSVTCDPDHKVWGVPENPRALTRTYFGDAAHTFRCKVGGMVHGLFLRGFLVFLWRNITRVAGELEFLFVEAKGKILSIAPRVVPEGLVGIGIIDAAHPEFYLRSGQNSDMPANRIDCFTSMFFIEPTEVCLKWYIVKWPNTLNFKCGIECWAFRAPMPFELRV